MSGLFAARVLADFYDTVTVVDRDVLPQGPTNRRGVPQGTHSHALLARGSQIVGELFPGLLEELVAEGVPVWADGDLSKLDVTIGGHRLVRTGRLRDPIPSAQYYPSRPLLEHQVRQHLRAMANVTILDGHDVVQLVTTTDRKRVTGVCVVNHNGGCETMLTADLVVDATGRGSRTPAFLEALGYGRPPEDELVVRLAYASQRMRIPSGRVEEVFFAVFAQPGRPTTFALAKCENDTWILTLSSMMGHVPPAQRAGMLRFAAEFAPPHALAAVRAAEPLGEVTRYQVPSNRWRRYDRMRRTPRGLLVVGDAMCSFNPIYGQGMTVAAVEATVLQQWLSRTEADQPRQFFRAAAKKIGVAWQTAVGSDLALPEVPGPRSRSMRITNVYLEHVLTAAETDSVVAERFLRVIGMVDAPARLLSPSTVVRIADAKRHCRGEHHRGEPTRAFGGRS